MLCCAVPCNPLQVSKGFAIAMQSLVANQTARGVSDQLLKAEKAKGAHMNSSLNSKDRLLHELQAQVRTARVLDSLTCLKHSQQRAMLQEWPDCDGWRCGVILCCCTLCVQVRDQASQLTKMRADAELLDSSLQESQRQAMALGTRLTLTENKNDELISQNQVPPFLLAVTCNSCLCRDSQWRQLVLLQ